MLRCAESVGQPEEPDFLQPGARQVCAVYRPNTLLVLTLGDGVNCFTLDRELGSFVLTQENLTMPADTREYSINLSNAQHWEAPVSRHIDELLAGGTGVRGQDFNMRWVASMVADVHLILTRGGVFLYPRDSREPDKPDKLRLMYEARGRERGESDGVDRRTGRPRRDLWPPAHPGSPDPRACTKEP